MRKLRGMRRHELHDDGITKMCSVIAAVVGTAVVTGVLSSNAQKKAAQKAADAQVQAAQLGIDEQGRQFDIARAETEKYYNLGTSEQRKYFEMARDETNKRFLDVQELLRPYYDTGMQGMTGQKNLLGLNGSTPQSEAIKALEGSPQFSALLQQGENGILQNASATGGLRGGNIQGTLAQYRPALLSGLIEQQLSRLGGLSSQGLQAAEFTGQAGTQAGATIANGALNTGNWIAQAGNNAGQAISQGALSTGNNVTNLLQQQGAARAGDELAAGRANAQMYTTIGNSIGQAFGMGSGGAGVGWGGGYTKFVGNNAGVMNSTGMTPNEMGSVF